MERHIKPVLWSTQIWMGGRLHRMLVAGKRHLHQGSVASTALMGSQGEQWDPWA